MKILHISTKFSQSSAGYRIHNELKKKGIKSYTLTSNRSSDNDRDLIISSYNRFKMHISYLYSDFIINKINKVKYGQYFSASEGISNTILDQIEKINPDIIHLHWINGGLLQISSLKKLNKPIIWTLHDSWPFTGGCHIPYACEEYKYNCSKCKKFSKNRINISKYLLNKKIREWENLNINVVAPSLWMFNRSKESKVFKHKPHYNIKNGIDLNVFKVINKNIARDNIGLDNNKVKILFGSVDSDSDPNKGFYMIQKLIKKLSLESDKYELIIFGARYNHDLDNYGIKINQMGIINDPKQLNLIYSSADIFLCPSISENLPNTILEAMSSGTPTVAFDIGGIGDIITHKKNGYLCKAYNYEELYEGIKWIINNDYENIRENGIRNIKNNFNIECITDQYVELYKDVLLKSKNCDFIK